MLQWTAQNLYCLGAVGEISMTHKYFIMWKKDNKDSHNLYAVKYKDSFLFFSSVMARKISFSFFLHVQYL